MDSTLNPNEKSRLIELRRLIIWTLCLFNIFFVSWCLFEIFSKKVSSTESENWLIENLGWIVQLILGACFSILAVVIVSKTKPSRGVVSLSGYLTAQGLATGFLMGLSLVNTSLQVFLILRGVINASAYALSLRFTQQFPTILSRDLINSSLKPRALRYIINAINGTLRVWIFSISIILLSYIIPFDFTFQIGQLVVIILVVTNLATNYRVNDKKGRKKIYWLLLGALCLLAGRVLIISSTAIFNVLEMSNIMIGGIARSSIWALANAGLIICLLMAIFYQGVLDSRLVFKRTAAISLGIGLLIFLFTALENFTSNIVVELLGVEKNITQSIFGGILALIFRPLQGLLNRFFENILPSTEPKDS